MRRCRQMLDWFQMLEMNFINQVWDQLIGQFLSGYDRVCVTPSLSYITLSDNVALEQHQYHISPRIWDLGTKWVTGSNTGVVSQFIQCLLGNLILSCPRVSHQASMNVLHIPDWKLTLVWPKSVPVIQSDSCPKLSKCPFGLPASGDVI